MKWSLVTGAAKGLGAAICMELASKKFPVVIQYNHSKNEALEVAKKCLKLTSEVEIIQGDFSSYKSTQKFIEAYLRNFSETKNLINNVGNYLLNSPSKTSISDWKRLFQVNLYAPLQLTKALLPSIEKAHGNILNIGVTGLQAVMADTVATAYIATKLSLWFSTKSLAKELIHKNVRVNMVSPGYMENAIDLPEDLSLYLENRPANLKEVARVVAFILDPSNSYITGQNIDVGGGFKI